MQKIGINLSNNNGFKWYEKDGIYVKGYIFDKNDNLYKNEKLLKFFENVKNEKDLNDKLIESNGLFSVIIKRKDKVFCAVDRTRTFPLFYSLKDNKIYISDNVEYLTTKIGRKFIELNVKEFLSTGYVTGNETLLENIYQIEVGNYLFYNKDELIIKEYFNYVTNKVSNKSFEQSQDEFLYILEKIIKRLIKFANGKQIVVPLSGGYDSRLIVALLKMYGYENVFCFTYGKKDSFEVDISKKVADKLGYKWYFVEYNEKIITPNYIHSDLFKRYIHFSMNYVSKPHLQDYFAVKYLKDNNLIKKDAIFVPGHSGDFLAGSHIINCKYENNKDLIIKDILFKHYNLNPYINKNVFRPKILKEIDFNGYGYSIYENWDLKERQAKFIINANRVYEFFDHNHFLPLWDKDMIRFFRFLPLEMKKEQYFYNEILLNDIFKKFQIDYKKKNKNTASYIKRMIPISLKVFIKNKLSFFNKDVNNFKFYTKPFFDDLGKRFKFSHIEYVYAQWCIKNMEK